MNSKDEMDNHANQLNPNNSAYWASRGNDEEPENWEETTASSDNSSSMVGYFERKEDHKMREMLLKVQGYKYYDQDGLLCVIERPNSSPS